MIVLPQTNVKKWSKFVVTEMTCEIENLNQMIMINISITFCLDYKAVSTYL